MNAEIYLIVKKVFACGFSWKDLEWYFSLSRKALEEHIKCFYEATEKRENISNLLRKIDENEEKRNEIYMAFQK